MAGHFASGSYAEDCKTLQKSNPTSLPVRWTAVRDFLLFTPL